VNFQSVGHVKLPQLPQKRKKRLFGIKNLPFKEGTAIEVSISKKEKL